MKRIRGLRRGGRLAVALSGGVDSMVLLQLLVRYKREVDQNVQIHAVTVDHGIRAESTTEAAAVASAVSGYDIEHAVLRITEEVKREQMERHARELRYKLLYGYCEEHGIGDVYMGHHEDDQLETFAMRLVKGSTLFGLLGMRDVQPGNLSGMHAVDIARPLLAVRKSDIYGYARRAGVTWFEDESNADTSLTARNALRAIIGGGEDGLLRGELVALYGRTVSVLAETVYARLEALEKNGVDVLSGIRASELFDARKLELRLAIYVPNGVTLNCVEEMVLNRWLFNKVWRVSPHKRYLYEFTRFDSIYSVVESRENGKSIADTLLSTVEGKKKRFTVAGCEFECKRDGDSVDVYVRRENPHRHSIDGERIRVVLKSGDSRLIDGRYFLKGPIDVELKNPASRDVSEIVDSIRAKRGIFV